jgi:hypothetical protein
MAFNKYLLLLLLLNFSSCCNEGLINRKANDDKSVGNQKNTIDIQKPGSNFQDTLFVKSFPVVLFYNPDSLQLDSLKMRTAVSVFQSQTHEYFFQMRNARLVLKRDWPFMNQVYTQHARYIEFENSKHHFLIDLNTLPDMSGIIIWNGNKKPHAIDMMNIETEMRYYFEK